MKRGRKPQQEPMPQYLVEDLVRVIQRCKKSCEDALTTLKVLYNSGDNVKPVVRQISYNIWQDMKVVPTASEGRYISKILLTWADKVPSERDSAVISVQNKLMELDAIELQLNSGHYALK